MCYYPIARAYPNSALNLGVGGWVGGKLEPLKVVEAAWFQMNRIRDRGGKKKKWLQKKRGRDPI